MELNFSITIEMSLITISALVKPDASFAFQPFGLPAKRNISVHQVASAPGMYQVCFKRWRSSLLILIHFCQIIYDSVFEGLPVVTATPAWLGQWGPGGGSPLDGLVINEITEVRHD